MNDMTEPDRMMPQPDGRPEGIDLERAAWRRGMAMGIVLCAAGMAIPLALVLDVLHVFLMPILEARQLELPGLSLHILALQTIIRFSLLQVLLSMIGCLAVYVAGKFLRSSSTPLVLSVFVAGAQSILTLIFAAGIFLPLFSLSAGGAAGG